MLPEWSIAVLHYFMVAFVLAINIFVLVIVY